MHGGRLVEKVIAHPSAVKAGLKDDTEEGAGSPGGKEAHCPGRSRLRQLRPIEGDDEALAQ